MAYYKARKAYLGRRMAVVQYLVATVLGSALAAAPLSSQAQLVGFRDCWFDEQLPDAVGLGQRWAAADRLDSFADDFVDFDYDRCFHLGRSCSAEFPLPRAKAVDKADLLCISLHPWLGPSDYETWLDQRTAYNSCMAVALRREAGAIRAAILGDGKGGTPLSEVLEAERTQRTLGAEEVAAVTTDVTWCPAANASFQAAILCRGGGMAAASGLGESQLRHRVSAEGELCLSDLLSPETCHRIDAARGQLSLQPAHPLISGSIRVKAGVESGGWQQGCAD